MLACTTFAFQDTLMAVKSRYLESLFGHQEEVENSNPECMTPKTARFMSLAALALRYLAQGLARALKLPFLICSMA
jgi:hypothetical protein